MSGRSSSRSVKTSSSGRRRWHPSRRNSVTHRRRFSLGPGEQYFNEFSQRLSLAVATITLSEDVGKPVAESVEAPGN